MTTYDPRKSIAAWALLGAQRYALLGALLACLDLALLARDASVGGNGAVSPSVGGGLGALVELSLAYAGAGLLAGTLLGVTGRLSVGEGLLRVALGLVGGGLASGHVISLLFRLESGSYLTIGALHFAANSASHVGAVLLSSYGLQLLLLFGVWLLVAGGLALASAPGRGQGGAGWRRLALGAGPGALLWVGPTVPARLPTVALTPEQALYGSYLRSLEPPPEEPDAEDASFELRARLGPARSASAMWKATADVGPRAPNVLLIQLESVPARALAPWGGDERTTPNLSELARRSVVFRRAWTTATHSNYAQMALLSSLVPRRGLGLDTYRRLDYPRVLWNDVLGHLGYATASITSQDERWQGMDRFQAGSPSHLFWNALHHKGRHFSIGSERIVPDHITAERAIEWIASQSGRWGLYVNFQATHFPYNRPESFERLHVPDDLEPGAFSYLRYPRALVGNARNRFLNALHYADAQIGALLRELERRRQLERTLIVVTSDHGELFHEHGMVTHGRSLFEEEARVPLLFSWPETLEPELSDVPVSTLSVLPTIVSLLGLPAHPAHQGQVLFAGGRVQSDGRAIVLNIQGLRSMEGLVCWPYKLVRDVESDRTLLFDLERDPDEQVDLGPRESARRARLADLLRGVMARQDAYHRKEQPLRLGYFAPRLPECVP